MMDSDALVSRYMIIQFNDFKMNPLTVLDIFKGWCPDDLRYTSINLNKAQGWSDIKYLLTNKT